MDFSNEFRQFSSANFPAPSAKIPYPEAANIVVGDAFFSTAQYLPSSQYSVDCTVMMMLICSDTRVVWGLNLGQKNLTATFLEVRALFRAFSLPNITNAGIALEAVEIGNEADLYVNNGIRAKGYEAAYVKECVVVTLVPRKDIDVTSRWVYFAANISATLNLTSKSPPHFWSASFAGSSGSTTGFSPQAIIDQGILNTYPGSFITTYV